MEETIAIVGSGNVARHLGDALAPLGLIRQVIGRNSENVQQLAASWSCSYASTLSDLAPDVRLVFLAVPDDAIANVAAEVENSDERLLVHLSGSVAIDALGTSVAHRAVSWPLQTFTAGKSVDWSSVPVCIEGSDQQTETRLSTVFGKLTSRSFTATAEQRQMLHIAAVFVNNFSNHMYRIGEDLADRAGLPFDLLHPLLEQTAEKARSMPPSAAQTGPANRGDEGVIQRHLEQLATDPAYQKIYNLVSQSIRRSNAQ